MSDATSPIQVAVFAALAGFGSLSALVGARVYPSLAPNPVTKPYVVWQEIFETPSNDLSGSALTGTLSRFLIQASSWAEGSRGPTIARDVDRQVRAAMIAATQFKALIVDARAMPYEPDTKLHCYQTDFAVWLRN